MREGWAYSTIGNLAETVTKGTTPTSVGYRFTDEGINFVKVESIDKDRRFRRDKFAHIDDACHRALSRSQLRAGDILFSIAGALGRVAEVRDEILPANTNQALAIIRLKRDVGVSTRFLIYALSSTALAQQIERDRGGVAQQNLSLAQIKNFAVPLPPLPEQKRIVAILDEAFAGIATAVANTEKNLANTRELFESYLNGVFRQRGKGWKRIDFSCAVSTVRPPRKIQRKEFKESGPFPIVSQERGKVNGRWSRLEDVIRVGEPLVIFGDHTRVFKYIDFDFVAGADGVKILRPATFLHAKYLYYFAQSLPLEGLGYARHYRILKDMDVWYPEDVFQQEAISIQLDGIVEDLNRLQAVYSQKLDALAELKQSLLQKAFSGELTANKEVSNAIHNKEEVA